MATRKAPETKPQPSLDKSNDKDLTDHVLSTGEFDHWVRILKISSVGIVGQVKTAADDQLERLGVQPDRTKAVAGVPDGSDQVDVRAFITWAEKLTRRHRKAVGQLVALQATAAARSL